MRTAISVFVTLLSLAATAAAEPTPKAPAPRASHDHGATKETPMVDLSQVSQNVASPVPMASGGPLSPVTRDAMTKIGDARMHSGAGAGAASREVTLAVPEKQHTERPAAGRRVQERMDARRVLAALEPSFVACAARGVTASPAMTLTLKLSVAPSGEVESAEVVDGLSPRSELAACVASVGVTAHFHAPGGVGASMVIPVSLPAHAYVSRVTASQPASAPPRAL
jgi:hypothetical protein